MMQRSFRGRPLRAIAAMVVGFVLIAGCVAAPAMAPTPPASASADPAPWASETALDPTLSAAPESARPTAARSPEPTPTETGQPTSSPRTVAPTEDPTPSPKATVASTPKPTREPTPVPTPTPTTGPSLLVRHGSRSGNDVALTFDMGGRVGDALTIVNWLVDRDVRATIFMTGWMAENPNTDAGRRVLGIVDDHPELFTLGNHSYTHRDFRDLTAADIRGELRRTEAAIEPYCSQDLRPFFRPPNGGYDGDVLAAVGASGYRDTVTWDVDTIDWRPIRNDPPGPTADQIVAKVLGNVEGGSIVLMHLGGYETFDALPRIVAGLDAAGYDLVTLDELL